MTPEELTDELRDLEHENQVLKTKLENQEDALAECMTRVRHLEKELKEVDAKTEIIIKFLSMKGEIEDYMADCDWYRDAWEGWRRL